jgi:ABC-2 type transport system permease protein
MFPGWLRQIAAWMPFQFITYAPARTFVDFELAFVLRAVAGQLAYIAIFGGIVAVVWWRAQRRIVVHGG